MVDIKNREHPVIFFDGVCNLCVGSVQFIIKHDRKKIFRFASLQGELGKNILLEANLNENDLSTFILWKDEKMYTKSAAALEVVKHLSGAWKLLYGLIILPSFLRDYFYTIISKHRYKWFGKKKECWMPTDEMKYLFME
jgi:predicted DCC family thiol-disulfide oxidoreductase YuxK